MSVIRHPFRRPLRLVSLLGVLLFCESQIGLAQSPYYYLKGKRIPLRVDQSKHYILLKATTSRNRVSETALDHDATVRQFKPLSSFANLDLERGLPDPRPNWAVIVGAETATDALKNTAIGPEILYIAPFFLTPDGATLGTSHLIYVKLRDKKDRDALKKIAAEYKVQLLGNNRLMPLWHTLACTNETGKNALEVANKLHESDLFEIAQPDFLFDFTSQCASDEHFRRQWGLRNTGQQIGRGRGTRGVDIEACKAWPYSTGRSVTVAIVDTGIETGHPDLKPNPTKSFDTVTATPSSHTVYRKHGTACAGIIGAKKGGREGVAGVAPDASLMSISHPLLKYEPNAQQQLASGITWAWKNGADVINNSWTARDLMKDEKTSDMIDEAIENALSKGRGGKGCVVVFISGNFDKRIPYPANSNDEILTVGAICPCGHRKSSGSCNLSSGWGSGFGPTLDVVAPGVWIPTTDLKGFSGYDTGNYFLGFDGTSAAAPHVSGVAALILAAAPDLKQEEVVEIIEKTAKKVGSYPYRTSADRPNGTWHKEMGYGLVNAKNCLDEIARRSPAAAITRLVPLIEKRETAFVRRLLAPPRLASRQTADPRASLDSYPSFLRTGVVLSENPADEGNLGARKLFSPGVHSIKEDPDPQSGGLLIPFWIKVICTFDSNPENTETFLGPGTFSPDKRKGRITNLQVIDRTDFTVNGADIPSSLLGPANRFREHHQIQVPDGWGEIDFQLVQREGKADWYVTPISEREAILTLWIERNPLTDSRSYLRVRLRKP